MPAISLQKIDYNDSVDKLNQGPMKREPLSGKVRYGKYLSLRKVPSYH